MEEDKEFLKLSIEDRCQHKVWKARLSGYEDAAKLFAQQNDNSPEFLKYLGLLKKFVIDRNAIAQAKGLTAVLAFVGNAACAPETVNDVMSGLVSNCFSSPRAKTRELALEIALMYIEIEEQDIVLEELIKGLDNKSPKVVAACITALREALHLFGSQVVTIKPLVKVLTKLLEDRDKRVRDESKMLCVEIYRWVGEFIKPQLQSLKPVTLTELEGEFQKSVGEEVAPTRYVRSQQERIAKAKEEGGDAVEESDEVFAAGPPQVDPYDLMTVVDVISKLPKNFYEQCEAKKSRERKKVLETLLQLTTNTKLEPGDYEDLVRMLMKLIAKDSKVLVVALATKCITNLVLGLRKKFQTYASDCIPAIFEKFKENKQKVVVALREAIDALYSISSFESMLEDIQTALDSKNPQVKAETCAFLTRCFSTCSSSAQVETCAYLTGSFCTCSSAPLNKKLLKALTVCLLKTLNDTDSVVREKSAEALGTALKVVGIEAMAPFLKEVDVTKMKQIRKFCKKAVVTAKPKQAPVAGKKPVSAPAKAINTERKENAPKSVLGGGKKRVKLAVKPESAPAHSKIVKPAPSQKGGVEPDEPEFKEQELIDEDLMEKASEIIDDVVSGLSSSNWKDRLAAVEKFLEVCQPMEKENIPAQVFIKLLAKKPGFKDNIKILKLRFEILAYNTDNAEIAAEDIPVVVEAFARLDEVLKSEQAIAVLGPRVDQLLVMGAMQYKYAHNELMADENICKADVISLCRSVTVTLVSLFDNPILAKEVSRDAIRDLISHLITVMLDSRLDDLLEGAQVVKYINVLILRVIMKSNPTHVLSALIKLLHDSVVSVNVSHRFTELVMEYLWKNICSISQVINELNIDRILLDIHVFMEAFPSSFWKERKDNTPMWIVKMILHYLVDIKDEDIMKHLSLISERQESELVNYLDKMFAMQKGDTSKVRKQIVTYRRKRSGKLIKIYSRSLN